MDCSRSSTRNGLEDRKRVFQVKETLCLQLPVSQKHSQTKHGLPPPLLYHHWVEDRGGLGETPERGKIKQKGKKEKALGRKG